MVATLVMVVVHSLVRMRLRWIVLRHMRLDILPRISLQRVLLRRQKCNLAYAIGVAQPVSVRIDTFGTGTVAESKLEKAARQIFDLRPAGIIQMLDLKRPIYRQTAAYGHMGRTDIDLPWERLDKVEALKEAVK